MKDCTWPKAQARNNCGGNKSSTAHTFAENVTGDASQERKKRGSWNLTQSVTCRTSRNCGAATSLTAAGPSAKLGLQQKQQTLLLLLSLSFHC